MQSAPGSIGQVREAATQLLFLAKGQGVPTFLVGHVTKDGSAGRPQVARAHRRHRALLRGRAPPFASRRARREEPLRRRLRAGRVRDDGRAACGRCRTRRSCSWPSARRARRVGGGGSRRGLAAPAGRGAGAGLAAHVRHPAPGLRHRPNRTSLLLAVLGEAAGLACSATTSS